jgi:tetratricopeptide (TPR) repeat protein
MSPEQVSGSPVDGRSDLFSLGVVLYELLTNRKPFQGDNLTAISYKIVHEDHTPPAELAPDVPPEFNGIVGRAMAKDPWNRYQRGKDLALALYQLKAQLEERRSQEDLGTMISAAAETVPTLKLSNLKAIAESGAPDPQETPAAFPPVAEASDSAATRKREGSGSFSQSGSRRPPAPSGEAPATPPPGSFEPTVAVSTTASSRPAPTMPVRPISGAKPKSRIGLIAGLAALVALAVAGYLVLRPTPAPPLAAATAPTVEPAQRAASAAVRKSVDEGKRLFEAGRYEESLALFRTVLASHPDDADARQFADKAEAAIKTRTEQAGRTAQIQNALDSARKAFSSKKWEEARDRAGDALALDAENAEAIKLRDDSVAKIDRAAAEKKKAEVQLAKIRAMPKVQPHGPEKVEQQGPMSPPAPAGATNATLRLLFESPISQGHVMVAVNDQILLRHPYNFKKRSGLFKSVDGTGTVSANIPVPTGPVTVKVWLSGPDISPAYATATASMLPAETRTLKVDYASGRLGVRVQ